VVECTELLANALVVAGDLHRARDLFAQLAEIEPENPHHEQQYRQVLTRLGEDAAVRPLSAHEAVQAFVVDEVEMNAPAVKQEYSDEVEEAVKAALTDSELLDSYNLPEKALAPLEKVLPKAPRDARLNARMATLYASAKRFADAARACDILAAVHAEEGNQEQEEQYKELAAKYKASAGGAGAPGTSSMDISSEWETAFESPAAAAPAGGAQEIVDEIKFYISQGMWSEAQSAAARCESVDARHPELAGLKAQIATATGAPSGFSVDVTPPAAASVQEFSFETATAVSQSPMPAAEFSVEVVPPVAAAAPAPAAKPADQFGEFLSDLDSALPQDFAVSAPPPPAAKAAAASAPISSVPPIAPPPIAVTPAAPAAPKSEEESLLDDMFQEFKEDAEQDTGETEDPETHYNLGVAFREMGLMDEAIGELQKVCTAIEKGVPFRDSIQAYTWLAQCFVDKGVPEASFKWYERALKMATGDDQRMALHYDLAGAYELAGNKTSALQHFMEVYGSNIDYRDVAERIKALKS
jgi:tetratricopeptide (TPR) repeat protein